MYIKCARKISRLVQRSTEFTNSAKFFYVSGVMSTLPVVPSRILLFRRPITELIIVPASKRYPGTSKSRSPNFAIGSRPDPLRRSLPASFNRRPLPGHCIYRSSGYILHFFFSFFFLYSFLSFFFLPRFSSSLTLNLFLSCFRSLFSSRTLFDIRHSFWFFCLSGEVHRSLFFTRGRKLDKTRKKNWFSREGSLRDLVSRIELVIVDISKVHGHWKTVQRCSHWRFFLFFSNKINEISSIKYTANFVTKRKVLTNFETELKNSLNTSSINILLV